MASTTQFNQLPPQGSSSHLDQNGTMAGGQQTDKQRQAANGQTRIAEVPECPALAPNIVISSEMEETGFAQPQWMVYRDGQFIHLTELLYHVGEQVDGQRTLDEIATRMSEAIDPKVSADNVR